MAVVLGTNSGFVSSAPSSDPHGAVKDNDYSANVSKDTSPVGNYKVTEMGWYCSYYSSETTFQLGIYNDDEGVPGDLLYYTDGSDSVTSTGWFKVTGLDWSLTSGTDYWLAVYVVDTLNPTKGDWATSGGSGFDSKAPGPLTSLDPYNGGVVQDSDAMYAVYALYEEIPGTNLKVNIGDTWKEMSAIKTNIGDSWKEVAAVKTNIGDTWKEVF